MAEMTRITGDPLLLGIASNALGMPDKNSTTELYPQPRLMNLIITSAKKKPLVATLSNYGEYYWWGKYNYLSPPSNLMSTLH